MVTTGFGFRVRLVANYDPSSGKEAYPAGIGPQADAIWSNALGQVMNDASVDASHVAKVFDYIHPAGVEEYATTRRDRKGFGSGAGAALTGLVISRLLHREAMLETDALCYLGKDREVIDVPGWRRDASTPPAAVRCGKYLFCSGQGPIDHASGEVVGQGDFQSQVSQTYDNLFRVLQAAGATPGDVVRTLEYTNPHNAYRQGLLNEARRDAYGDLLPSVTTVTANQILPAEASFGMEVWAALE